MQNRYRIIKLAILIFSITLYNSGTTDADLIDSLIIASNTAEATTLDFSNRNTANNSQTNLLFNTNAIVPGGFDIKAIRIRKDGDLAFSYEITTEITSGNPTFCQNIKMTILKSWTTIYEGDLPNTLVSTILNENGVDDLIIVINLDNNDQSLVNQSCFFNIKFKTFLDGSSFDDEEILDNTITSGNWVI